MKIRNGFVSNSSSSSFICNICGGLEGGYECSLSDVEMEECEHGHTFHLEHADKNFFEDATKEERYESLKKRYIEDNEANKQQLQDYKDKLAGKKKVTSWEQSDIDKNPNYLQEKIDSYIQRLLQDDEDMETLNTDYQTLSDEDFEDEYDDLIAEYICDNGVPEEYCPVCQQIKEYEKDEDWKTYLELKEKFNGICL